MKGLWMLLAAVMLLFSLTACETMKGFGRDVEEAGEWLQEKAR